MVVGYFNVGSGVFKMDSNGRSAKKEKYLEKDSEKKIPIRKTKTVNNKSSGPMQKLKILDLRFARLLSVYIKTSSSSKYDYVNISRFPPSVRYTSQCVPGTSSSSKYEYSTGINISRFPPYPSVRSTSQCVH